MNIEIKTYRNITKAEEPFLLLDLDMPYYVFERRLYKLAVAEFPQNVDNNPNIRQFMDAHRHAIYPTLEPKRGINWTHRSFMKTMRKRRGSPNSPAQPFKIITNRYANSVSGKEYYGKSYVYVSTCNCDTIVQVEELLYDVLAEIKEQWSTRNEENGNKPCRVAVPYGFLCRQDSCGIRRFHWKEVYRVLHFLSELHTVLYF